MRYINNGSEISLSARASIECLSAVDTLCVRYFGNHSDPHPDVGHSTGFCDSNCENKDHMFQWVIQRERESSICIPVI